MEIDLDLYNKLLKIGIFRPNTGAKINNDKKKVALDKDTKTLFELGVILSKYLLVLIETIKEKGSELHIQKNAFKNIKYQDSTEARQSNWTILIKEMSNFGVIIDPETQSLLTGGDKPAICSIFTKVETNIQKIMNIQLSDADYSKLPITPRHESYINGGSIKEVSVIDDKQSMARKGYKGPPPKKKVVKEGVDILTMNIERELGDTESTIEFLLNTLCRAFSLKPKQAAALLSNNNQFLIFTVVKGLRGKFEPVLAWYQDLYKGSKTLTSMLEMEKEQLNLQNLRSMMHTVSCGLLSNNYDVAKWCFKLMTTIGEDFSSNQEMYDETVEWFTEPDGGLQVSLICLKKHKELMEEFVLFCTQFSSHTSQLENLFKVELRKYFPTNRDYICQVNDLFTYFKTQCSQELLSSGLIDYWVDTCVKLAENDGKTTPDERISALSLLAEIWLHYIQYIDEKIEMNQSIVTSYKKGVRDKNRPLRIVSISIMFRMLEKFSEDRNHNAPIIYQILRESLCEKPSDSIAREQFFTNFEALFKNKSIPISNLLVKPLFDQIQKEQNITFFFKSFDFQFFSVIAVHPKLLLPEAVQMAQLLAQIYQDEPCYSSAVTVPFIKVATRFINDADMQQVLSKIMNESIEKLQDLEQNGDKIKENYKTQLAIMAASKDKNRKIMALPPPTKTYRAPGKRMTNEEKKVIEEEQNNDMLRRLKKGYIVKMCLNIQSLKNDIVNEELREYLMVQGKVFRDSYGYYNKGMQALLKWWGDADTIMDSYIKHINDMIQAEIEQKARLERMEQERIKREKEEKDRLEREEKERRAQHVKEKMALLAAGGSITEPMDEEEKQMMVGFMMEEEADMRKKLMNSQSMGALQPYFAKFNNPKNKKALREIQKVKSKYDSRIKAICDEKKEKDARDSKMTKKLKELLEKRKIELGVSTMNTLDEQRNLVYKDGKYDKIVKLEKALELPQIILLNLSEEEDRDSETVNQYIKKYAKLWKYLYTRYANSGYSSKVIRNFEQMGEKLATIQLSEIIRMLKDHSVYPDFVNKEFIKALVRIVNTKIMSRLDMTSLTYEGFVQFLLQLAYYIFTRPPTDLTAFPPIETLYAFVAHLKQATADRGQATVLYDDPDTTDIGDKELVKEVNKKLQTDPQYPIPKGYYKLVEKNTNYLYRLPEAVVEQLPESSAVCIETLDELLFKVLDIHFLEPIVTFEEKFKIRPQIQNQFKQQAEALNYMKKLDKKEKPMALNDRALLDATQKRKMDKEIKPKLSIALKLEVAKVDLGEQPFMKDVAEVVEEMLLAVEKGLDTLPTRAHTLPGQLWNPAKEKYQNERVAHENMLDEKEQKRVTRKAFLDNKIEKYKDKREAELEETRQQREDEQQQKDEREQRIKDRKREALDTMKSEFADRRQANLDELQRKKEEEEQEKQEDEENKKQNRVQFLRNQKQQLQEHFNQIQQDRNTLKLKKKEIKERDKQIDNDIRAKMEAFIKDTTTQQDRGKEMKDREEINRFYQEPDVQQVFSLYNKSLLYYYQFYTKQEIKGIEFTMSKNMSNLTFREFVKFGYQSNIVPVLLPPDDFIYIYRQSIRERIEEISGNQVEHYFWDKDTKQMLDFEYFKKSLIRVAVMAQDALGGQQDDLLQIKLEQEYQRKQEDEKKKHKLKQKIDKQTKEQQEYELKLKEDYDQHKLIVDERVTKNREKSLAKNKEKLEELTEGVEESIQEQEDQCFLQWVKQQDVMHSSLHKRIEKAPLQEATIKQKKKVLPPVIATIKNQKGMNKSQTAKHLELPSQSQEQPNQQSLNLLLSPNRTRVNREVKQYIDLQEKVRQQDAISSIKVEKKIIRNPLDVNIISAKTIEVLMKFIGIMPDDTIDGMNAKLNQQRIEIQGQKPDKVIKEQRKTDRIKEETIGPHNRMESTTNNDGNFERDASPEQR